MGSIWMRLGIATALAVAGCALSGCAGSGGDSLSGGLSPAPAPIRLGSGRPLAEYAAAAPVLPSLAELDRVASDAPRGTQELFSFEPITLRGDSFMLADDDATINGDFDSAELPAGSRDATWVIYRFQGLPLDAMLGYVEVAIADTTPQVLYYGLADYSAETWQWFTLDVPDLGDLDGIFSQPLEQGGDYISDTGSLYLAVATWDGASCQVLRCMLHVGVREVYVQGLSASDGLSDDEIVINWDELPGAAGYELYFRLAEFPGSLILLAEVAGAETTAFSHSATDPPDHVALKDTPYIYFIMALFPDGYRSQLSGWDTGYRGSYP